ncbi:hypothetical protein P3X46_003328 [Hevea brasiliensis]|uniref:Uncharacterized protein n=1 Tax=Hevea brasiliensis TaxID=3981 RepID=A0ABQ9N8A9_HEVBR|nr:hypothetical protein P3X46_003328 [Hevea brasiliensis]
MKKRKHMDGGRRAIGEEEEKEEGEEEKINTFYTLIRNIRDAHNQMLIGSSTTSKGKGEEKKGEIKPSTWTPSFTWEDFAGDSYFKHNIVTVPSSTYSKNEQLKTEKKEDLDLNLSL